MGTITIGPISISWRNPDKSALERWERLMMEADTLATQNPIAPSGVLPGIPVDEPVKARTVYQPTTHPRT